MVDPAKLQAGAIAVYGESVFQDTYGDLIPVNEADVITAGDNDTLSLGERTLTFINTPGHARHHFCVYDDASESIFTGDAFGLAYQELAMEGKPFLFPTTTPVQFDPDAMKSSLNKIMAWRPKNLFLTHYGKIEANEALLHDMLAQIDDYVAIGLKYQHVEHRQQAIADRLMEYLIDRKREQGFVFTDDKARAVLKSDISLNAQGLDVWLQRQAVSKD